MNRKMAANKIRVITVGSDDRPALNTDLEYLQKMIEENPNKELASHLMEHQLKKNILICHLLVHC